MRVRDVSTEEYIDKYRDLQDDRDKVGAGDVCIGLWFDGPCVEFVADQLETRGEHFVGLGYVDEDSLSDIGYAYHVVILRKG